MASIEDFLEMFNNNDLDVEKYFGGYDVWFNMLKKRGLMGEVDPHNAAGSEVWQNEYFLWLYDNDRPNYYKWMQSILGDITVIDGKVYFEGDREDLARFFCDGSRYDMSRDTVEKILSGDGDIWDPYWDTTQDVYSDVIEELDKENLQTFKERIIEDLKGKQLSPETELMESIASEQGHDDYWELNTENVDIILKDSESMENLLDDELSDIKSELYSIHNNAYNAAYEHEVYDEVYSELKEYFDMDNGQWLTVKHPYKQNTQIEKFRVPIHDFEGLINDYLFNNKGYGNSGTLDYHGSFVETISEDRDCLHAQPPDYPDSRLIDKNINEYFKDFF